MIYIADIGDDTYKIGFASTSHHIPYRVRDAKSKYGEAELVASFPGSRADEAAIHYALRRLRISAGTYRYPEIFRIPRSTLNEILEVLENGTELETYDSTEVKGGYVKASKRAHVTYYVTLKTHRRMRQYSVEHGVSLQAMLNEAMDLFFAAKGEPPIDKWPRSKDEGAE